MPRESCTNNAPLPPFPLHTLAASTEGGIVCRLNRAFRGLIVNTLSLETAASREPAPCVQSLDAPIEAILFSSDRISVLSDLSI